MANTEQLITEHLDLWSSAVKAKSSAGRGSSKKLELYGITKLRGLILDLAMRGMLVPQDPEDEPAAELLKRIIFEREQTSQRSKINIKKYLGKVDQDEYSFPIPPGWEITRVGALFSAVYGKGLPTSELTKDGYMVFGANGIIGNYSKYMYEKPQLLISCRGAYSGKPNISPSECFVTSNSIVLENSWNHLSLKFFFYALTSAKKSQIVTGSAQPQVTSSNLNPFPLLLPPLAEQRRIVGKVDELMALCDQLEQEQESNLETHETLVSTLLNALTSVSADASQLAEAWQSIQSNFDILFTTESSINKLKKTILQLAVMGKLVPQDPENESAAELLNKIADEKERLFKEKKIKKPKPLTAIPPEDEPYKVHSSWEWCRLGELSLSSDSGWSPQCNPGTRDNEEQWGVLKVSAVSWGEFRADEHKKLPVGKEAQPECEVKNGDFLLSRANTEELVARGVVVVQPPPRLMMSDKIVRFSISEQISKVFINLANASDSSREYYKTNSSGTSSSMKNVTRETMSNLLIPVPPLAEQHRIVAKVDELMALCEQLKANLAQAQATQLNLADSLVEQAIQ